jgi:hypothetical protein
MKLHGRGSCFYPHTRKATFQISKANVLHGVLYSRAHGNGIFFTVKKNKKKLNDSPLGMWVPLVGSGFRPFLPSFLPDLFNLQTLTSHRLALSRDALRSGDVDRSRLSLESRPTSSHGLRR